MNYFKITTKLYIIIVFLLTLNCYSQNNLLKYKCYFNTSFPFTMDAYLQFNDESSYFKVDFNTRKITREHLSELKDTEPLIKPLNKIDLYYFKKDSLVLNYTEWLGKEEVLIKDELPRIDWVITNETKQINKFLAYKATGDFRGRKWISWFTPDLPYSFGPWKLNGLPGVILLAYDSEQRYSYQLVEIIAQSDLKLREEFLKKTKNVRELPLKIYWEEYWEGLENAINLAATNHRATVTSKNDIRTKNSRMELIYEWEEDVKKE